MSLRSAGFTAWFEGVEVGVMMGRCDDYLSLDSCISMATFDFEICYELSEISRIPSPDEIVFQFNLL
jgi:hypothetical protein